MKTVSLVHADQNASGADATEGGDAENSGTCARVQRREARKCVTRPQFAAVLHRALRTAGVPQTEFAELIGLSDKKLGEVFAGKVAFHADDLLKQHIKVRRVAALVADALAAVSDDTATHGGIPQEQHLALVMSEAGEWAALVAAGIIDRAKAEKELVDVQNAVARALKDLRAGVSR